MAKRNITQTDQAETGGQGPSKRQQKEAPRKGSVETIQSLEFPHANLLGLTPWISAAIPHELPPLPPILDPKLEQEAFTHPGAHQVSNYEKLEWFGDACIEIFATDLIIDTFRNTPASRCNQIREQLVRNVTLAQFYRAYGMESRTRLPTDMESMAVLMRTKPKDKAVIKIQGDVFESYVGAVVRSDPKNGRNVAAQWLKALWGREIKDQIVAAERDAGKQQQSNQLAESSGGGETKRLLPKEALASMIKAKGVRLRYVDEPKSGIKKDRHLNLPLYIIGVYLDGWGETNKLLGVGSALKKTEAGQKAATMALENKKLMKLYADKKMALQEAQKAAETAVEGQQS